MDTASDVNRRTESEVRITPLAIASDDEGSALLLSQAKAYRSSKQFPLAKQTYLELISRYPDGNTAANATVALAQMELGVFRDSRAALDHFDDYLEKYPLGDLADEACIGRVRALMKLEVYQAAITAADAYLEKHPSGAVATEMLRQRGEAHVQLQSCEAALQSSDRLVSSKVGNK